MLHLAMTGDIGPTYIHLILFVINHTHLLVVDYTLQPLCSFFALNSFVCNFSIRFQSLHKPSNMNNEPDCTLTRRLRAVLCRPDLSVGCAAAPSWLPKYKVDDDGQIPLVMHVGQYSPHCCCSVYVLYWRHTQRRHRRGVAIYVRASIQSTLWFNSADHRN